MKPTILYIDDEEINLRVFAAVYRQEYNVITATSAEEGLKLFDKDNCHLIITDQYMPKMTGVEFLKEIAKIIPGKSPSRIILSGYSQSDDIEEAKKKYFLYTFISKPWDAEKLKIIIDEAITVNFSLNEL